MNCPKCDSKTSVIDSWNRGKQVLRRRKCTGCSTIIETRERRTIHEPEESRWNTIRGERKT